MDKEPKLEVSLNWFGKWRLKWSCSESTLNQLAVKLADPLKQGIKIGTGVLIGIGTTVYVSVQTINHVNSGPQSNQIATPAQIQKR